MLYINTVKIKDYVISYLKACPRNAKKHNAAQVQQIARSIEVFGFNNPVLIDSNGEIIAGHGRFEAAQLLQLDKVPCIILEHLNDEQKRAFRIADNRLSEQGGGWDEDLLMLELSELKAVDFDTEITGFDDQHWQKMLPEKMTRSTDQDDMAPELPDDKDTQSRTGDVWLLGNHRLMCGDSTIQQDMRKLVGDHPVDCIWTDPPYNVNYQGGTEKQLTIKNDRMEFTAFCQFLLRIFENAFAVARTGCPIYVAYADSENIAFRGALTNTGWKLSQTLIWMKQHFKLSRQDYHWQHEPIIYGWKEGSEHSWYGGRTQTTIMDANLVLDNMSHEALLKLAKAWQYVIASTVIKAKKPNTSKEHPTMKPVTLIMRMLQNSSQPGDRVLDPCGGSGSTLIACEKLKRHALLMEIDPKYCDVIIRRWQTFTGKDAVHETTGQTFTMKEKQVI